MTVSITWKNLCFGSVQNSPYWKSLLKPRYYLWSSYAPNHWFAQPQFGKICIDYKKYYIIENILYGWLFWYLHGCFLTWKNLCMGSVQNSLLKNTFDLSLRLVIWKTFSAFVMWKTQYSHILLTVFSQSYNQCVKNSGHYGQLDAVDKPVTREH